MRILIGACLAAAVAAAPAAAEPSRQTASLKFTTMTPGAPTGVVLDADYFDPANPEGKPPAVRRVVTTLASGARYDTSVPEQCTASDAELMLAGPSACPAGSVVGTGWLTFDSGAGDTTAGVSFHNRTDELIFVNTVQGTPARTVLRAPISGTTITSDVPTLPGTPPDGGALDQVHYEDFPVVKDGRGYITTPPTCPTGTWINSVTFTYADGVTQTVRSASPCTKPKPQAKPKPKPKPKKKRKRSKRRR